MSAAASANNSYPSASFSEPAHGLLHIRLNGGESELIVKLSNLVCVEHNIKEKSIALYFASSNGRPPLYVGDADWPKLQQVVSIGAIGGY